MLDFDFKENLPTLLLVLATVILAVTFSLPVGGERRRSVTRYQGLSGFSGAFDVRQTSAPAVVTQSSVQASVQAAEAPREPGGLPPGHRRTPARRRSPKPRADDSDAPSHRWPHLVAARAPSVIETAVAISSVTLSTAPLADKVVAAPPPVPAAVKAPPETADFVAESYENDPAKYPMDRSVSREEIALSLRGLSRQRGRYILKVAIDNGGGEDFFVKEFSLRSGPTTLTAKSFFRLFVEPGRSREGFVVFDAPRSGADVHVVLKEDREKGRVLELPVPYPF